MATFTDIETQLRATLLDNISTANGRNTDMKTVHWTHKMWDEVPGNELPAILILEGPTDDEDIPSRTTRHVTTIFLDCFTAKAPAEDAREGLWNLHEDILTVLRLNSRLGGCAISVTTKRSVPTYHEDGTIGQMRIGIEVKWEQELATV